jgi:hypothetical protein
MREDRQGPKIGNSARVGVLSLPIVAPLQTRPTIVGPASIKRERRRRAETVTAFASR